MESPEEEKSHLLLRVFTLPFVVEHVNSLDDDWLSEVEKLLEINFLVEVTIKAGFKPVVVTLCTLIICLQHWRYAVVVTNSEANSDKYQQVGRSHANLKKNPKNKS